MNVPVNWAEFTPWGQALSNPDRYQMTARLEYCQFRMERSSLRLPSVSQPFGAGPVQA
jgi:hypothetical protein